MLYFKQGLLETLDLFIVLLLEIKDHGYRGASITLLKLASIWAHIEPHIAYFVCLVVSVTRHNDGSFEFIDYGLLDFCVLRRFVGEALAFLVETFDLLVDELQAIVD